MEDKNFIVGKLEKRISKKTGNPYYVIDVYAKNPKSGEVKSISGGKPIFLNEDRVQLLTELYNIPVLEVK